MAFIVVSLKVCEAYIGLAASEDDDLEGHYGCD